MPIEQAALNLMAALTFGAVIGSERQIRQRMAGLRTNALVALGAAGFVVFSTLVPGDASPTRVAAQVVSGIGFLGAGIIFRDGFNVHGLNTAATLWCSAGVGLLAGSGHLDYGALMTGLVVFINLGLRPLVKWIKRRSRAGVPVLRQFEVEATCEPDHEAEVRAMLLRSLAMAGFHMSGLAGGQTAAGQRKLTLSLTAEGLPDHAVEQVIAQLAAQPRLTGIRWATPDEG